MSACLLVFFCSNIFVFLYNNSFLLLLEYRWHLSTIHWIPVVPTHLKSGCYCVLQIFRRTSLWGLLVYFAGFCLETTQCFSRCINFSHQLHLLLLVHLKNSRCFRWYVDFIYSYMCVHFKSSAPLFLSMLSNAIEVYLHAAEWNTIS